MSWQNHAPFSGIDKKVSMKDTDRMPFLQPIGPDGKPIVFVPYDFSNWESDRIKRLTMNNAFTSLVSESKKQTEMGHLPQFHSSSLERASPYPQNKKYEFVSTSDGKIGFLAQDYKSHTAGQSNNRMCAFWIKIKMKDPKEPDMEIEYMQENDRDIALQEMCDILHQNKNAQ